MGDATPPPDGPVARLLLEYDGTDFAGWAAQPGRRTVQPELERVLRVLLATEAVPLTVAGRTDAGVHAIGQVVSYPGPPVAVGSLNALLPDDVAVRVCEPAPPGFCARRDATSRAYRYRLLTRAARSPFEARTALHWPHRLDVPALRACAAALRAAHDFTAFTPTETAHVHFTRVVIHAAWERDGDHLDFLVEADAFLRHMVRVLVGTMIEVGRGRRTPNGFAELLRGAPRADAGATAPPHGLTLLGVGYGGRRVLGAADGAASAARASWTARAMRVLLTNDDGIEAEGLQALRRALVALDDIELVAIAPDGNRSATARSITTRRPLAVREVAFDDGTTGYATDGTPVDCVRLANLGLVDGFRPDLVVAGINHGANLGDDVTYSGTVAAALEAIVLGLPGLAVSQQPERGPDDRAEPRFDFAASAAFAARLVTRIAEEPLPERTLLNVNVPAGEPQGVEVAGLGRRVYRDELALAEEADGTRSFWIYGEALVDEQETGTDLAAVAAGRIALTPLHFDLTDAAGLDALARADLRALLEPIADEVPEP